VGLHNGANNDGFVICNRTPSPGEYKAGFDKCICRVFSKGTSSFSSLVCALCMELVHFLYRSIELASSIEVKCAQMPSTFELSGNELSEFPQFMLGKSLYDTREYRRAASSLEKCSSVKATFLRLYSLYMVSVLYSNNVVADNFKIVCSFPEFQQLWEELPLHP